MITREIINKKIKFFELSGVKDYYKLSDKIDQFKNGILSKFPSLDFSCVLGMDSVEFDVIAFLFALLELNIPIVNARSQKCVFLDKELQKNKIFIRECDYHFVEKTHSQSLDIVTIESLICDTKAHSSLINVNNKDGLILTYFSSGTTGAPKKFYHSHLSVLESAKNSKRFFDEGDTMLWRSELSINHFGIFTTSVLPALMYCDNIILFDKNVYDQTSLFKSMDAHNVRISAALILAHSTDTLRPFRHHFGKKVKIITGGRNFAGEIYESAKKIIITPDCRIFNVYGCTELATPLLWKELHVTKRYSLEDFVTFDEKIDGLEIITNGGLIEGFKPHPVFFSSDEENLKIPDDIKISENHYVFINRKQMSIFIPGVYDNGETDVMVLNDLHFQSFLTTLTSGLITYLRVANKNQTNLLDAATLEIFSEYPINKTLDEIHIDFFDYMKQEFNLNLDRSFKIFSGVTVSSDLPLLNNGLKFDSAKLKDLLVK